MKKHLAVIVSIVLLLILGCDGQDLRHASASEVLKRHQLLDSFSERIQFTPKKYTEIQHDTILASGYNVKIKYYSDMDLSTSIIKYYKADALSIKHYYRRFNANIDITQKEKIIFSEVINTTFLEQQINVQLTDYILTNIELLQSPEDLLYTTQLYLEFCKPGNKRCKKYILRFQKDNTFYIKETDNNYVRT
ncbi:hypothetical protein ES676_13605 [Bizionia saleffrena]|uniref:Lipoprotein n=1 Tax=Bizionia saleffrena TaxID=291189 RepID=A0A8H2LEZ1_9FLAO|nr:hypothetical protein [Bizionia saleffrena]TYB70047.1 hypothetical protein ES676_13605 [Bizionia saleffrena]